jgi:hypothetical protein
LRLRRFADPSTRSIALASEIAIAFDSVDRTAIGTSPGNP